MVMEMMLVVLLVMVLVVMEMMVVMVVVVRGDGSRVNHFSFFGLPCI